MSHSIFAPVACLLMVGVLVSATVAARAEVLAYEAPTAQRLGGTFVWTQSEPPWEQTYAAFRKTFDLNEAPLQATLRDNVRGPG
jgi:hypothetical protein